MGSSQQKKNRLRNKEAVLMLVVTSETASPTPQNAGMNTGNKRTLFDKTFAKYSMQNRRLK